MLFPGASQVVLRFPSLRLYTDKNAWDKERTEVSVGSTETCREAYPSWKNCLTLDLCLFSFFFKEGKKKEPLDISYY